MKRVLMIAFHFPPVAMGSGHLRTLGFVRHLPALGWEPSVGDDGDAVGDGLCTAGWTADGRRVVGLYGHEPITT